MIKNKSFTLIELLVVIVIIGILAGVIIVSTSSSINRANIAKVQVFSESVKNELMLNLISEYGFNEGAGLTTKDSWGSSADGVLDCYGTGCQNPTWSSNCISENCLEFHRLNIDGLVGSRVKIPQNSLINLKENKSFTIEYWLNKNDYISGIYATIMKGWFNSSYGHLISYGALTIYTDGDDSGELNISNFFSSGEKGKWIHVVQTFNGDQIIVYKNSETNNSYKSAFGITSTINTAPLYIGSNDGTRYFFDGLIDEVRIYDTALSSSQIKQNYIAGLNSLLASGSISKEEYDQRLNNLAQK